MSVNWVRVTYWHRTLCFGHTEDMSLEPYCYWIRSTGLLPFPCQQRCSFITIKVLYFCMNDWQSGKGMDCNTSPASIAGSVPGYPFQYKILAEWVPLREHAGQQPSSGSNAGRPAVAHPRATRCERSEQGPGESEEAGRFCLSEDDSVLSTGLSPVECKGFSALIRPVRMTGLSGTSPWLARTDIRSPVHLGTAPSLASLPPGLSLPCAIIPNNDSKWFG